MLAAKTVLAGQDETATLVFDEIDANVGGRLGDVLGQKLAALGQTHQVICVTHLPQVASYAKHHWTIRKSKRGGRTLTQIAELNGPDRLEELATMLRGEARSETTRKEAAAMLEAARRGGEAVREDVHRDVGATAEPGVSGEEAVAAVDDGGGELQGVGGLDVVWSRGWPGADTRPSSV
ncbi:MAG: hypothetical protein U0797_04765 [Gemmataceae bacterium]